MPKELDKIKNKGFNMGGFVPFLYSLMIDYRNKQSNFETVVEIGVRWGTSTNAFLYGIRNRNEKVKKSDVHLYSIDINDCCNSVKDETLLPYWTFIQDKSENVGWVKEKPIDILLIDGDHSYEGCKTDYLKFEPFVREGGLILFHDVLLEKSGVNKFFWNEIDYPKSALPLSKSGMGIVFKKL